MRTQLEEALDALSAAAALAAQDNLTFAVLHERLDRLDMWTAHAASVGATDEQIDEARDVGLFFEHRQPART